MTASMTRTRRRTRRELSGADPIGTLWGLLTAQAHHD
jgi:hypothetical protein